MRGDHRQHKRRTTDASRPYCDVSVAAETDDNDDDDDDVHSLRTRHMLPCIDESCRLRHTKSPHFKRKLTFYTVN